MLRKLITTLLAMTMLVCPCASAEITHTALTGHWYDSWSQRAQMTISYDGEKYSILIHWANSTFENTEWTMSGVFENSTLHASDCTKSINTYTEDGSVIQSILYQNGEAHLEYANGVIRWIDTSEDMGADCRFERVSGALETEMPSNTLEALFGYRYFDENTQKYYILPGSAKYVDTITKLANDESFTQTSNGLRLSVLRSVAVNDLYALEWTVENISSEPIYLLSGSMSINSDPSGAYSGHSLSNMLIMPGEILTGFAKNMTPGITGDHCTIALSYSEYAIKETAIPEDHSKVFYPTEDDIELTCEDLFEITVSRSEQPALTLNESCLEAEQHIGAMTLRLTEAQLSISGGSFSFEGIFDTYEEAIAQNPCGSQSGWGCFLRFDPEVPMTDQIDGSEWIQIGGGEIPDAPVQLEDGRWAWQLTLTADFLHALPENVYLLPYTQTGDELAKPLEDKAIAIQFSNTGC